jgi:hypothetical protein
VSPASLLARVRRRHTPEWFTGELAAGERVLGYGGSREVLLVATSLGLCVPFDGAHRRVGWHLLSKAAWSDGVLTITEADEVGTAGEAVLLADREPVSYRLAQSRDIPQLVAQRVTESVTSSEHRELPGGGARFVRRKVPGRGGVVLQVRIDPGADEQAVRAIAAQVAEGLRGARDTGAG